MLRWIASAIWRRRKWKKKLGWISGKIYGRILWSNSRGKIFEQIYWKLAKYFCIRAWKKSWTYLTRSCMGVHGSNMKMIFTIIFTFEEQLEEFYVKNADRSADNCSEKSKRTFSQLNNVVLVKYWESISPQIPPISLRAIFFVRWKFWIISAENL